MPASKIVIDTSVVIELIKGNLAVTQKVNTYEVILVSPIVLSELYFGAYRSANPKKHLKKIKLALTKSTVLPINSTTTKTFVSIKVALYAKGNVIPDNDIWIASAAMQKRLPLYTNDKHFKRINGLLLD